MMRKRTKATPEDFADAKEDEWELRPCGMVVQKRNPDSAPAAASAPVIRVRVKHGFATHEIYISSQATFGELKKMLSSPTGLHHEDQKIMFKKKERRSSAFLDTSGVKDRSKMAVVEDEAAHAKRCLEMRRSVQKEKAAKSILEVGLHVDKLATKVSALKAIISYGKKVAEEDVSDLIEMLMNELLKLDAVVADGDAKANRQILMKRIQKYVETLDMIKIETLDMTKIKNTCTQNHLKQHENQNASPTKWETFDSLFSPKIAMKTQESARPIPRFDWELF